MPRKKKSGFGDVVTDRASFDRGDARCPSCKRPIGPEGKPAFVQTLGAGESRLATMRCGRCNAMLTIRFEDAKPSEETSPERTTS
jgi:hypothetical protein